MAGRRKKRAGQKIRFERIGRDFMQKVRSDPGVGVRYVSDVLSTFEDPKLAAAIAIEESWISLREREKLRELGKLKELGSLVRGEFGMSRLALLSAASCYVGSGPVDLSSVKAFLREFVIDATGGYYIDPRTQMASSTLQSFIDRALKIGVKLGIFRISGGKVERLVEDEAELCSKIWGSSLHHGLGVGSLARALVLMLVGETPGIEKQGIPYRLYAYHRARFVRPDYVDRVLFVHGPTGSGYVLEFGNSLYRCYERVALGTTREGGIFASEEGARAVDLIRKVPAVPHSILEQLFGAKFAGRLRAEVATYRPTPARAVIVRRGDLYFSGAHVMALRLKKIPLERNPALELVRAVYESFSPEDIVRAAAAARNVAEELVKSGECRPEDAAERKVCTILARRGLVSPSGEDKYAAANPQVLRDVLVILGRVVV